MAAATSTPAAASQLDVVFDGTWLFVPFDGPSVARPGVAALGLWRTICP